MRRFAAPVGLAIMTLLIGASGPSAAPSPYAARSIGALSCTPTGQCLAVTTTGEAIVTTDIGGARPRWTTSQLPGATKLVSASCPTADVCVATSEAGRVYLSHDAFASRPHWRREGVPAAFGVDCPSISLCVLVGDRPGLIVSTDPLDPHPQWTTHLAATRAQQFNLGDTTGVIACAPEGGCALGTLMGSVIVVHDPTAPHAVAQSLGVERNSTYDTIACAAPDHCIASNEDGTGIVTRGDGLRSWRLTRFDRKAFGAEGSACPARASCLVTDGYSDVLTSTQAFAPTSPWYRREIDPHSGLLGAACPTPALCVVFDDTGRILRGSNPFSREPRWKIVLAA